MDDEKCGRTRSWSVLGYCAKFLLRSAYTREMRVRRLLWPQSRHERIILTRRAANVYATDNFLFIIIGTLKSINWETCYILRRCDAIRCATTSPTPLFIAAAVHIEGDFSTLTSSTAIYWPGHIAQKIENSGEWTFGRTWGKQLNCEIAVEMNRSRGTVNNARFSKCGQFNWVVGE